MKPELKQTNKKHKTGSKSKRQLKAENKGRLNEVTKSNRKMKNTTKSTRKAQKKQKIKQQMHEIAMDHASFGGPSGPPILCLVVPLDTAVSPWMLRSLIKSCVPEDHWREAQQPGETSHFSLPRFKKRLALRLASYSNLFATLDLAKVADIVIFAVKSWETLAQDEYALTMLSALYSQGLPRCIYTALSSTFDVQGFRKFIESKYPIGKNQFWTVHNESSTQLFLRYLCQSLPTDVSFRKRRSYMLAEAMSVVSVESDIPQLHVCGHLRGRPLDVNGFVHITGVGDFAVMQIDRQLDPNPARPQKTPDRRDVDEVSLAVRSAPFTTESEEMEEVTMEKEDEADDEEVEDIMSDDDEEDEAISIKDGSSSDEGMSMSGEDEEEDEEGSTQGELMAVEDLPDPSVDSELARFRRAREEAQFPDEVDSPLDMPVHERFKRYQSLASLLTGGKVDASCLPPICRSLINFTNYRHVRNRIMKLAVVDPKEANPDIVSAGPFVRLRLRPLKSDTLSGGPPAHPVVLFSLFPFEERHTLVHCVLHGHRPQSFDAQSDAAEAEEEDGAAMETPGLDFSRFDTDDLGEFYPEERQEQRRAALRTPIRSKDPMVMQLGFRRLLSRPIYSEDGGHGAGWHKFRRFFSAGEPMVASLVAPVAYTPCPVLMFRGACREVLAATGSVTSCAPRRWCLKRVLLSGHPMKIRGRAVIVRYMFFNANDVDYYKSLEVRTKSGRRGRITESLGTHGLMKCRFDRNLSQMDVVTMPLYKPMYPKEAPTDAALYRLKEPAYRRT